MPDSRPTPTPAPSAGPRAALEALLAGPSGGTLRRALWLDAVDQLLRPHLPPELAAHTRLANVRGDKLVFVVNAPVWHARLRLATPGLIDIARSIGLEVNDVRVKTTTAPLRPTPPATAHRPPVSATAQSGLATALALLRTEPVEGDDGGGRGGHAPGPGAPAGPGEGAS